MVWEGAGVLLIREDAGHGVHLGRQDPRWMMSFHPVASFRGRYRRFSGAPSFRPHKGVSMEANRVMGIPNPKLGRKSSLRLGNSRGSQPCGIKGGAHLCPSQGFI